MVIADIPGLIEGAHEGRGLGITFLKHVERTRFLVHILAAEDLNRDDPMDGYEMLTQELREYSAELGEKVQIKAINKIDTLSEEELADIKAKVEAPAKRFLYLRSHRRRCRRFASGHVGTSRQDRRSRGCRG